ncbi:MAG: DUF1553 domain-containing protein [Acidobacteria bacterium]|nr:DUF1553 domain-containing protein [Acidobacteriota bacterium]
MRWIAILAAGVAWADTAAEFFEKSIRPVLVEKCQPCHNSKLKAPMGGLRLDSAAGLRKGGDTGPAVTPGAPEKSLLLKAIGYRDLDLKMPPTGKLADEEIAAFRRWIEMGAPDPREAGAPASKVSGIDLAEGRKFWAFQPVGKAALPTVRDSGWPSSPVDRFILAGLESRGLRPAPPADKRVWVRRVTFDLIGLPPTPAEVTAYLADSSAEAEKAVVERLLASPHYGERWGRHWLDLVRFAETNGHEFDNTKLDAWRYRDYVIRAFNQDLPYDQFVREHLAGDLLPNPRLTADGAFLESPLGTSFYWFGEVLNSATDSVKSRADEVDNQIDVISKAFQGLTVSCARCHDHKFDPIRTADYYALAGILHSTDVREAVIDSPARAREVARSAPGAPAPLPVIEGAGDVRWTASGAAYQAPVSAGAPLAGSLTSSKFRMPSLWVHIRMRGSAHDGNAKEDAALRVTLIADGHKSLHAFPSGKPEFEWKTLRATKEIGRLCYFEIVDRSTSGFLQVERIVISDSSEPPAGDPGEPVQLSGAVQAPPSAFGMIATDLDPADVRLHIRGSHKNLGEPVARGFLAVIAGEQQTPVRGIGRLELAERIASPSNPLTARVMVNRIWKHHFGHGIVRSADNFGRMGERPSHPELLDYLARAFVESGWSIKEMHRMIVLSSAYRMSGRVAPEAAKLDPRNDLLHHMPVRRLEAETIRDSLLAVSGKLDRTQFGPGVTPHISRYQDGRGKPKSGPLDGAGRRSIYIQVRRNFITPMFLAFDYPLPVSSIGARGVSTVPSQALMMMNNELVVDAATAWARRTEGEPDAARRIRAMYQEAFGRTPEQWELNETLAFVRQRPWADLCHVLFNSAEFVYVQ